MKTYPMLSFRCNKKLQEAIKLEAKRQKISVGELMRQVLSNHIAQKRS